jgi:stage III sporulation protein AG
MNSEKLTEFIVKLKKDKKTALIIFTAILGMLLILFSGTPAEKTEKASESKTEEMIDWEEKLQKLLSTVEGAGRVRVMITYETSDEDVFAYNKDESFRENEEKFSSDYILVENNGSETGLKLKTVYPEVKGVAVVCDGADDPVTKEQIISVISALFDISTKNISVVSAE